jgi:hypothetical protein
MVLFFSQEHLYSQEKTVFEDSFSDNRNYWPLSNNDWWNIEIKNGKLSIQSKTDSVGSWIANTISINTSHNFLIECMVERAVGTDTYGYGIVFGQDDKSNYYYFLISPNGYYTFQKVESGKIKELITWTKSDAIIENGLNKIQIKKINNTLNFYVNDKLVNDYFFMDFYGAKISLYITGRQTVLFDDLLIKELPSETQVAANPNTTITIGNARVAEDPVKYEKRVALVIGNANYKNGVALKNPVNDANLISYTLKNLGFEVIVRLDATKSVMENAVREFSKKLPYYNIALVYYAGHGIMVDGINYLIPVDANLAEKGDVKYEAMSVNFITEEFERYPENVNVIILDACRTNPFRAWARGNEQGFKAIPPASGTIISFATSEGATASDGAGANGLFTEELVKQMVIPQRIEDVFIQTRRMVEQKTSGQQSPQEWSKLRGMFYFKK